MAAELYSTPTAETFDVEDLASQAWSGAIRVPHFQRDFRWGWQDVRKLFDSIIRGYPIGSLLLWRRNAPEQSLELGSLKIEAPSIAEALWVVDGQQRVTSLANALSPEGSRDARFALAYDLRKRGLVRPPTVTDPLVIPLPVLFDLQELLKWFAQHAQIGDYIDEATRVAKKIRQYEVPAYSVKSDDQEVLQDIFDRMNNFGKKLSRAEIFSAINASDEASHEAGLSLSGVAASIDDSFGFGVIDDDTILACILARRDADIRRDIRSEFGGEGDEGRDRAYEAGAGAMRLAVSFLQVDAHVPHYTFLTYRYLIVVLTRLFAHHPELSRRNRELLRRWYWRAAVAGPENFKGGTPNAARVLCRKINPTDETSSIQELLSAVSGTQNRLPDTSRFASKDAGTKTLLCSMWWHAPRDPSSGTQFEIADLSETLRDAKTAQPAIASIYAKSSVASDLRPLAGNRALVPSRTIDPEEAVGLILEPTPALNSERLTEIQGSHFFSLDMAARARSGGVDDVIRERQEILENNLRAFIDKMCEWGFESTPPLADLNLDEE